MKTIVKIASIMSVATLFGVIIPHTLSEPLRGALVWGNIVVMVVSVGLFVVGSWPRKP